jgi:hypothetical protein
MNPGEMNLLGGEMYAWSDEDPARGRPPAGGGALTALAAAVVTPGARVLVAGPHQRELVTRLLDGGATVTWLLRSRPDATAIAADLADRGALTVACGDLARFEYAEPGYDVVVALDGVRRLWSAETDAVPDWPGAVQALLRAARPGAAVLLAADNQLGLHRLVALEPPYAANADGDWLPAVGRDATAPAGLSALLNAVTGLGLRVGKAILGYADPTAPSVLMSRYVARGPLALDGHLDAVMSAACDAAYAGRPVLADPRRLAADALRAGSAAELAPLWIVAGTAGDPADPADEPPFREVPEVLVAEATGHADVAYAIVPDGHGGWLRRLLPAGPRAENASPVARAPIDGPVRRDPALLVGPLPAGRRLVDLAREDCLTRDVPALRGRLTAYAGWLAGAGSAGELPGMAFATLDNVVVADGEHALIDPSWQAEQPQPTERVLLRALHGLAVALITSGNRHPWPQELDADSLTVVLAGLAGREVDRAAVRAAVGGEIVTASSAPPDVDSHRELRAAYERQRAQLTAAAEKLAWYEHLLSSREDSLRRAQRTIELFSGSPTYRATKLAAHAVRRAKRVPGGLRRRWRQYRATPPEGS